MQVEFDYNTWKDVSDLGGGGWFGPDQELSEHFIKSGRLINF